MKSIVLAVLSLGVILAANVVFADTYCQTDNNSAGIPNMCSSSDGSSWQYHDCSVTCHTGMAVCNPGHWIKAQNGTCGYVIQPVCFCNGSAQSFSTESPVTY